MCSTEMRDWVSGHSVSSLTPPLPISPQLSTLVARELGLADALQSKEGTTPRVAIRNVPESWGEDRLRDALASLGVGEPVGVEVKGRSGTM